MASDTFSYSKLWLYHCSQANSVVVIYKEQPNGLVFLINTFLTSTSLHVCTEPSVSPEIAYIRKIVNDKNVYSCSIYVILEETIIINKKLTHVTSDLIILQETAISFELHSLQFKSPLGLAYIFFSFQFIYNVLFSGHNSLFSFKCLL